jgi:hypothetical protein
MEETTPTAERVERRGARKGERRGGRRTGIPNRASAKRAAEALLAVTGGATPLGEGEALEQMRYSAGILRVLMMDAYERAQRGVGLSNELLLRTKDYVWALEKIVPYEEAKLVSVEKQGEQVEAPPIEFTMKIGNAGPDGSRTFSEVRVSPPLALSEAGVGNLLADGRERRAGGVLND